MSSTYRLALLPVRIKVDDAYADILEVLELESPSGRKTYHITVRLMWRDITTKPFFIDVTDIRNMVDALRIELTKIKVLVLTRGKDYTRRVVG